MRSDNRQVFYKIATTSFTSPGWFTAFDADSTSHHRFV